MEEDRQDRIGYVGEDENQEVDGNQEADENLEDAIPVDEALADVSQADVVLADAILEDNYWAPQYWVEVQQHLEGILLWVLVYWADILELAYWADILHDRNCLVGHIGYVAVVL